MSTWDFINPVRWGGSLWSNSLFWTALAAVPPLIVLLYFLKLKRTPLEVPSTYLWHKSIEDLHVNSIWQRLRRNLLLFLQLLLLLLLLIALLRPSWGAKKLSGDRFIFLSDVSNLRGSERGQLGEVHRTECFEQRPFRKPIPEIAVKLIGFLGRLKWSLILERLGRIKKLVEGDFLAIMTCEEALAGNGDGRVALRALRCVACHFVPQCDPIRAFADDVHDHVFTSTPCSVSGGSPT